MVIVDEGTERCLFCVTLQKHNFVTPKWTSSPVRHVFIYIINKYRWIIILIINKRIHM
jgi:hypothetical protein